jgi:hypothetical protein
MAPQNHRDVNIGCRNGVNRDQAARRASGSGSSVQLDWSKTLD